MNDNIGPSIRVIEELGIAFLAFSPAWLPEQEEQFMMLSRIGDKSLK